MVLGTRLLLAGLVSLLLPVQLRSQGPPDVRYRLRAAVDDRSRRVTGTVEIRYRQTGPDTARWITISLGRSVLHDLRLDGAPSALDASEDQAGRRLALPHPLLPGDSVVLTAAWESSLPIPRTPAASAGRRLELIDWYPRVIDVASGTTVPDPAFGTVLLRLDVAEDQVVAGTGVPLCGDPGWHGAAAFPATRVTLQRDWYRDPRDPQARHPVCAEAPANRKQVMWYAEDVMEMALAMSPSFKYEEGDFLERPVHTLYEQGEERVWGAGLATRRTEAGLAWILELGGRYPWPQLTVVQGDERPGRARPMLLLAEAPTQAAILTLLGLIATQQVISGGARVFTLGTAAYQTAWFFETLGRRGGYARIEREILDWDLDGLARRDEPLGVTTGASPCITTYCRRTEFMSYQLRHWAGSDETMRRLYRALYTRFQLRPTVPGAFQAVAGELIQPRPDSLYTQLPRGGTLYDDAIASARREPSDSGWRTTVVIQRRAAGLFPQTLWIIADSDTAVARATALTPRETLAVVTRTRPRRAVLDPLAESHDWNMLNNQHAFGFSPGWLLMAPHRHLDTYLDTYFARHTARDRLTVGLAPTAWFNDLGGWTFGARLREDYLGRFELNDAWISLGTGWGARNGRAAVGGRVTLRNPVALRATGWSQELGAAWEEGRVAARIGVARRFRNGVGDRTDRSLGLSLAWLGVTDAAYLDSRSWDDAGTLELTLTGTVARSEGTWPVRVGAAVAGGYGYPNESSSAAEGAYGRLTLEGSVRSASSSRLSVGVRMYAGATVSGDSTPRQRRIPLAGADPYQRFGSPFLRSRGSLLAGNDFHYHAPGGAGLRGFAPWLGAPQAVGASVEMEYALSRRAPGGLLYRIAIAGFADGALGNGDLEEGGGSLASAADAGIGLRLDHRLGRTPFQTRLDLPLWVSRPALAQDDGPSRPLGFRWTFSFVPAF